MDKKYNKTIVFVNQSSGYLMVDIVNAFASAFEERILLAGSINQRNKNLDPDVRIRKIIAYERTSILKRFVPWVIGFLQILFYIKLTKRKADLFLVSNPPLAPLMPLYCKNPFSLLIYDIFPDTLVENHILKENSWIVRWWQKANRKIFRKAQRIFTLSEGMKTVLSKYVSYESITVIPLWTDNQFIKPIPREENFFIREQGLEEKFVVMYSGNLGKTHDVEIMIDLALEIRDERIFFLIIGSGEKYEKLVKKINELQLKNIRILPWQDTDRIPYTLGAANIGVVSIKKDISQLSVPSKTYDLLSVGVPVLCISSADSELNGLVDTNNIGECFEADQLPGMCEFIKKLANDDELYHRYSQNALKSAISFSPDNAKLFLI